MISITMLLGFLLIPMPDSVNKKVHFSPQIPTDARQTLQSKPRFASGSFFSRHEYLVPSLL